jgi:hypothetical protein
MTAKIKFASRILNYIAILLLVFFGFVFVWVNSTLNKGRIIDVVGAVLIFLGCSLFVAELYLNTHGSE